VRTCHKLSSRRTKSPAEFPAPYNPDPAERYDLSSPTKALPETLTDHNANRLSYIGIYHELMILRLQCFKRQYDERFSEVDL